MLDHFPAVTSNRTWRSSSSQPDTPRSCTPCRKATYREEEAAKRTLTANINNNNRTTERILPGSIVLHANTAIAASKPSAIHLRAEPLYREPSAADSGSSLETSCIEILWFRDAIAFLTPSSRRTVLKSNGAQGRIRTSVARKERQIYSLLPLTARPPVHNRVRSS
jgi:hypothetical protein